MRTLSMCRSLLFSALALLIANSASAQYYWADAPGFIDFPPGYDQATTASLESGGDVVNQFDIYTTESGARLVPASAITQPIRPRSLGVAIVESDGSNLNGQITIKGVNQFGNLCEDRLVFSAGTKFAATYNAYAYIRAIEIVLSATDSGDVLNISTYGYGLSGKYLPTQVIAARLLSEATPSSAGTATLDTRYGVAYVSESTSGTSVLFSYYSSSRIAPSSGFATRRATATGSGGGGW